MKGGPATKNGYMAGFVTKGQYAKTLREYQLSHEEGAARDKALAYDQINSIND